ncbi:MAG: DUF190 domain-containing protein [Prevotella sp.]|nr:DUF190 domain-containing protein [Prevotella sp.]MDY5258033.1 DUF190 domain-containing protein [Prevotella sp.]
MEKILRIYLSSTDTYKHQSLYEVITRSAKQLGIDGATVLRGSMGFGKSSQLRSDKFWEFNLKQPIVIEMIDEEDKLLTFTDNLKTLMSDIPKGILITMEDVKVLYHKTGVKA